MEVLIDILLVWVLFSVCITPILLVVQIIMNARWYKKFYALITTIQKTKHTDIY